MIKTLFSTLLFLTIASNTNGQREGFKRIKKDSGIKWCKENLKVTQFRNGTPLFHAKNMEELKHATGNEIPAYINLDLDKKNFKKYGYLYNGYAVFNSQGLVPKGFRLPNEDEYLSSYSDFKIHPEYDKKHKKNKSVNFYLSGTQDPFGGSVGMGEFANLWIMPDSLKYRDYRKAITITNIENWERELSTEVIAEEHIWAKDAHLQNFYFVRCIEDSLNDIIKTNMCRPMRNIIDLSIESYNYYDLLICDTFLFDVSDLIDYEISTKNKENPNLKNINLKNVVDYYAEEVFVDLEFIDRKSLIKLAKEKVVIIYSNDLGLRKKL